MKLHTIIFITLVGFFLSACSEPDLESSASGLNSRPALWVVTHEQSKVYLFGSMHALPPMVKWYGPELRRSFETSDELVFETLDNKENRERYLTYSKKLGLLPEGKVISDYLTAPEYKRYMEIVKLTELDRYYANRMKPWLFMLSINSIANKKMSPYGVDTIFQKEAIKRGKRVASLESVYSGLSALSSVPLEKDIKNLKEILNKKMTKEESKEAFFKRAEMLISWATGDTDRTKRILANETPSYMYNKLIVQRNNQWYPKIKSYLSKNQTTMIIVGQAHLIGKENILSKLKRSGYKVRRIQ